MISGLNLDFLRDDLVFLKNVFILEEYGRTMMYKLIPSSCNLTNKIPLLPSSQLVYQRTRQTIF